MRVNPWFIAVLLFLLTDVIIFVAAKVYWTSPALPVAVGSASPVSVSAVSSVRVASALPASSPVSQSACIAGQMWTYYPGNARWFNVHKPCKLGTVRSEDDREGLIVRHPKGWHPPDANLTQ